MLLAEIEAANSALKTYQPLITFTFDGTIPLEATTATTIPTTLSLNGQSITVDLNFTVNNTWTQVRSGLNANGNFIYGLSKVGSNYFLTDFNSDTQGLYRSTDGTSWTKVLGGSGNDYHFANPPVKIGNITYLFSPQSTTYRYSDDDGNTWYRASNNSLGSAHFYNPVQIRNHWYVPTTNNGLLRGNLNSSNLVGPISGTQGLTGRSYPTIFNNKIYWNTENGLYESDDGADFRKITGGLPNPWDGYGKLSEINGVYYASNGSLWKSPNGTTDWNQNGIPQALKQGGIISSPIAIDNILFLPTYQIGLWTKKGDGNWTLNQDIDKTASVLNVTKLNGTYYCTTDKGLYTSKDDEHWQQNMTSALINADTTGPFQINNSYYLGTRSKGLWTIPIV